MNIKIRSIEIDKAITTFVAINLDDGSIVGKCSLKIRGNKTLRYQDAEVIRRYRGNGIYKKLFLARERFIKRNKLDNYRIESYCKEINIQKGNFKSSLVICLGDSSSHPHTGNILNCKCVAKRAIFQQNMSKALACA
ncbi:MAG: hypothetical protein CM15mP101_09120 [Flavobacteriaceae bacterium]|nr:MAG: hypothetical protein CM15mP101_09120 [Flavobacteriaceae bacterium]